jgi:uncharacterized NAD-dependent epimerase/dehydratase family protein
MHTALHEYRYLILTEGAFGPQTSKTANSAIRYLPERVVGVIDSRHAGRTAHEVIGLGGGIPVVATLEQGLALRPTALLIGVAPSGGQLPPAWRAILLAAMDAGLHLVSGLHFHLGDDPELASHAAACGVQIHDLRRPPADLSVSRGLARDVEPLVVHTVGTDCNIGKMTAALELRGALEREGVRVGFVPTGQTGILIDGWGIAVDAVIADFIAGAAERLVLQAAAGSDVVLVEGQGSLVHPAYSGVTLGLLHGSLPDALILCHQPSRRSPYGSGGAYGWMALPSVAEAIALCESAIRPLKEARVIAIALNTWDLTDEEARHVIERTAAETGLPVTDPVRCDPAPLAAAILEAHARKRARLAAGRAATPAHGAFPVAERS